MVERSFGAVPGPVKAILLLYFLVTTLTFLKVKAERYFFQNLSSCMTVTGVNLSHGN